jgi:hypothetical protein
LSSTDPCGQAAVDWQKNRRDVSGGVAGHFIPEEKLDEVGAAMFEFLA